jgi:iron complex transport system ATP-binding protein
MLSVYALVALGRHPHTGWTGTLSTRDERIVRWAIEIVGATALAKRRVNELSDGERQKVLIARALAQEPGLIVLDEPTAFLDLPRRVDIMSTLRRLAHITKRAVLLSTHDLDLAMRSADRVWLMPPNGAVQEGAPEDLVLNGAFERTFHSEGVVFDPGSGSFKINDSPCGPIDLLGEGLNAVWTARALERIGYRVNRGIMDAPATVEVLPDNSWLLVGGELRQSFNSLYDLVTFLQQPLPRPVETKVECL